MSWWCHPPRYRSFHYACRTSRVGHYIRHNDESASYFHFEIWMDHPMLLGERGTKAIMSCSCTNPSQPYFLRSPAAQRRTTLRSKNAIQPKTCLHPCPRSPNSERRERMPRMRCCDGDAGGASTTERARMFVVMFQEMNSAKWGLQLEPNHSRHPSRST